MKTLVMTGQGSPVSMVRNSDETCPRPCRRGLNPRPVGVKPSALPLGYSTPTNITKILCKDSNVLREEDLINVEFQVDHVCMHFISTDCVLMGSAGLTRRFKRQFLDADNQIQYSIQVV